MVKPIAMTSRRTCMPWPIQDTLQSQWDSMNTLHSSPSGETNPQ